MARRASFNKRLAAIQERIAAARDTLRKEQDALTELLSTATAVESGLADALENLEYAIDRLSEQQ